MQFYGLLRLAFSIGVWMVGAFSIPVALGFLFFRIYTPVYILATYYSFRFLFPARFWPWFLELMDMTAAPYCKTQRVVFEDGATSPAPDSKTMVALSPHGILTIGWMTMITSKEFRNSGFKWLVAEVLNMLPFLADINTWCNITGCGKKDMITYMSSGTNVALIPGGFEEATIYKRGCHRIFIKERKGFVKYALQYGYKIMPAYVFGEENTYWQMDMGPSPSFALWLNKYKIPTTFFVGKYFFMPDNDANINVVVGKPLDLPKLESPSVADVDKYHSLYIEAVQGIFDRNKGKFGISKDVALEVY